MVVFHDIPFRLMTMDVAEGICETIGEVIRAIGAENEEGGSFILVRVKTWVSFKYECLPNLCYCCGRLNHGDKDRPLWIQSRGILKEDIKKQKKISSSLRAPPYLPSNQNVIFVLGYFNKLGSTGKEARRVEVATLTTVAENHEKLLWRRRTQLWKLKNSGESKMLR